MENLPLERISIAVGAISSARIAYKWAKDYVFECKAFGKAIGDLQTHLASTGQRITDNTDQLSNQWATAQWFLIQDRLLRRSFKADAASPIETVTATELAHSMFLSSWPTNRPIGTQFAKCISVKHFS